MFMNGKRTCHVCVLDDDFCPNVIWTAGGEAESLRCQVQRLNVGQWQPTETGKSQLFDPDNVALRRVKSDGSLRMAHKRSVLDGQLATSADRHGRFSFYLQSIKKKHFNLKGKGQSTGDVLRVDWKIPDGKRLLQRRRPLRWTDDSSVSVRHGGRWRYDSSGSLHERRPAAPMTDGSLASLPVLDKPPSHYYRNQVKKNIFWLFQSVDRFLLSGISGQLGNLISFKQQSPFFSFLPFKIIIPKTYQQLWWA